MLIAKSRFDDGEQLAPSSRDPVQVVQSILVTPSQVLSEEVAIAKDRVYWGAQIVAQFCQDPRSFRWHGQRVREVLSACWSCSAIFSSKRSNSIGFVS